jgi:hypothetical protein
VYRAFRALPATLALLLMAPNGTADLTPAPPGTDAREIARSAEDTLRSARTILEAQMTVISPRLSSPRVVRFRSWEERDTKKSMIRISQPAKDAGTGFLKLESNLWMFVPRVLGIDPAPEGNPGLSAYVVDYIPHEDAPVVWGKITAWIEREHSTPLQQEFYDEEGQLMRRMRFSDIRTVGERRVPHHWSMVPMDKEGHSTTIIIEEIIFDAEIPPEVFTKRNLRKARR